jgi:hypothetical protein
MQRWMHACGLAHRLSIADKLPNDALVGMRKPLGAELPCGDAWRIDLVCGASILEASLFVRWFSKKAHPGSGEPKSVATQLWRVSFFSSVSHQRAVPVLRPRSAISRQARAFILPTRRVGKKPSKHGRNRSDERWMPQDACRRLVPTIGIPQRQRHSFLSSTEREKRKHSQPRQDLGGHKRGKKHSCNVPEKSMATRAAARGQIVECARCERGCNVETAWENRCSSCCKRALLGDSERTGPKGAPFRNSGAMQSTRVESVCSRLWYDQCRQSTLGTSVPIHGDSVHGQHPFGTVPGIMAALGVAQSAGHSSAGSTR